MKQKFFALAFLVLLILTIGIISAANVEHVGDWWGTVTVNGNAGNNGAVVDAYINGNKAASATVGEYETNYYLIHVEGVSGDEIAFKVNGAEAETVGWSGGDHRLDLEVTIQEESTGGSPGSSGSTSSGSSSSSSSISLESSQEDTENDFSELANSKTGESETLPEETLQTSIFSKMTGAVTGFVKTKSTVRTIIAFLIVVCGAGVILIKFKPLKKWTKSS